MVMMTPVVMMMMAMKMIIYDRGDVAMTRYLQGFLIHTPGHDGGGITLKDNDGDGDDRGNDVNDKEASGDCHSYNHESFQCPPK